MEEKYGDAIRLYQNIFIPTRIYPLLFACEREAGAGEGYFSTESTTRKRKRVKPLRHNTF